MSRPKAFLKAEKSKKKHARNEIPQGADEILAEGVELEEAGEKWRAGDAVKSMRFFNRALEMYNHGLQKFPNNLDLAYNKARIQYEMATHPVLVTQLSAPLLDVLNETLASHQYALQLDQDNPDTLFNTGQVLRSIAEEIAKDDQKPDTEAIQLLEQSLELLQRCLSIQELRFTENEAQIKAAMAAAEEETEQAQPEAAAPESAAETETASSSNGPEQEQEQWASIVEPVTKNSLLDTALAQINALTTLSGLLVGSSASILPWVEEYSTNILNKIPSYLEGSSETDTAAVLERTSEIALAKASLISALLEANFRAARITFESYKTERDTAFADPALSLSTSAEACIANASSLIALNAAAADMVDPTLSADFPTLLVIRWQTLSSATDQLTKASKLPNLDSDDLATTHALRGDIALLQLRLGQPPNSYAPAANNAAILIKNAVTFYRNAAKLAPNPSAQRDEAMAKGLVAAVLQTGGSKPDNMAELVKGLKKSVVQSTFAEMVDEGLVTPEVVEGVWALFQ